MRSGVRPSPRPWAPPTSILSACGDWEPQHSQLLGGLRPLGSLSGLDSESGGPWVVGPRPPWAQRAAVSVPG